MATTSETRRPACRNLVLQRVQMATLNGTLNRLLRITLFANIAGVLLRRVRP